MSVAKVGFSKRPRGGAVADRGWDLKETTLVHVQYTRTRLHGWQVRRACVPLAHLLAGVDRDKGGCRYVGSHENNRRTTVPFISPPLSCPLRGARREQVEFF